MRRGNYKANRSLTKLYLEYNSVGDAGAVALAETLKATAVTCTHEFREDALVSCSPMRLKQLMRLCSCFSCCFLCPERNSTQRCLAQDELRESILLMWHGATTNL